MGAGCANHLPLNQKVDGSIPGSNSMCNCPYGGGSNSYIQVHEKYFHCLPPRLLDETLDGDPEAIAEVVPAR